MATIREYKTIRTPLPGGTWVRFCITFGDLLANMVVAPCWFIRGFFVYYAAPVKRLLGKSDRLVRWGTYIKTKLTGGYSIKIKSAKVGDILKNKKGDVFLYQDRIEVEDRGVKVIHDIRNICRGHTMLISDSDFNEMTKVSEHEKIHI